MFKANLKASPYRRVGKLSLLWSKLSLTPVTTEPNWPQLRAMGDAERTQDRQTDRKLGPGVLGAWVEMHNSLIASYLY
jgi:hypothetical protein